MRVLIISRTPWSTSNSFGNTFSNLFGGIEDLEIYHICCQHGATNNTLAEKTFQMTDKSVLKSILKRRSKTGWCVENVGNESSNPYNTEVSETAVKKKKTIAYFARDLIWKLGSWKRDKAFLEFLAEANPDVLYLPIYSSVYMCKVQSYVVKRLNVPAVGHISDDVFSCSAKDAPLDKLYKRGLHKNLKALIKRCSYLEVFAENMKREYEAALGVRCHLIGKGVDIAKIPMDPYRDANRNPIHFVYTGNIGSGRGMMLYQIGKALEDHDSGTCGVLDIYSATLLTDEMKKLFEECPCILFHGAVSAEEVISIQASADWLVHVEGFTKEVIDSTRMSFSTKLIDYMMAGKPIFAVGDSKINSIQVLQSHKVAVVASSEGEISSAVDLILAGQVDLTELQRNVSDYLVSKRNRTTIQEGIYTRLQSLLSEKV